MATFYAQVTGIADLKATIRALDIGMQQKTMIEVARAGAAIILEDAKSMVARESGALANDLRIIERKTALLHEGLVQVGPAKLGWRAKFIERGVRAHEIRTKKKRVLADAATRKVFGPLVKHPGFRARPFMAPALAKNRDRAIEIMKQRILELIQKIA